MDDIDRLKLLQEAASLLLVADDFAANLQRSLDIPYTPPPLAGIRQARNVLGLLIEDFLPAPVLTTAGMKDTSNLP